MTTFLSTVAAMFIGGTVAIVTTVGVINSQTSAPDKTPVSVDSPAISYGSNN